MEINREYKKTIGSKILRIIILFILILAVTMGSVSVYVVTKLSQEYSEKIMVEICDNEALQINSELDMVSHSVEMVYEYIDKLEEQDESGFSIFSSASELKIKNLALAVASKTRGAMAVYFRFNPQITGNGTGGFFWSRGNDTEEFIEQSPTNILAYYREDVEHVGWFYIPEETGRAVWMRPYFNENLKVFMISYVIPVYLRNGDLAGVLGMDIDFYQLLTVIQNVHLYNTGYVALVDLKDRIVFKDGKNGMIVTERLTNSVYNHITTINPKSDILTIYDDRGNASSICYKKLDNGLVMCIIVPVDEINSRRNRLAVICVIISLLVFAGAAFAILNRIKKIIDPIKKLTEVTGKYARGEWAENYLSDTDDEISELSESISMMAKNTLKYIGEINSFARRDAMTGINNKTYYLERVEAIKANSEMPEYAVTVMDLNLLKHTNDMYGHEAGDLLIKEAGKYISRIFSRSEVFRVGGDEFVVISFGNDYVDRERLLDKFENGMFYEIEGFDGVKLAISFGMACVPMDAEDYDLAFKLADQKMYAKKKEMKMGRTD